MAEITFRENETETENGAARVIALGISHGSTTPTEFAAALARQEHLFVPKPGHGLILDGRGPIWGYAMMLHAAHPSSWVGVRDPRLGVVIVESHVPGVVVGKTIPWPR